MTRRVEVPECKVGDLREYVPAIRYAVRLAKERQREHRRRMEAVGFVLARRHRRELEELVEAVEGE